MSGLAELLGVTLPLLAAPMAGGPTTPAMVAAATKAGSAGFLAGGYKSPELLADQIGEVRATVPIFGVNLFAPNPVRVDLDAFRRFAAALQAEAELYGLDFAASLPVEDDDAWEAKIDLLVSDPVPVVSFTFGIPDSAVVASLRRAGSFLVQTITSPEEARGAAESGMDALAVQGNGAGGHYGTLTPDRPGGHTPLTELVSKVRDEVDLPLLAGGGVATSSDVAALLAAGADAVVVGTLLLRTEESGASQAYKDALAARSDAGTIVTRAFTGRPARALPNIFTDRYDEIAPSGYPAIHHLTSPLRRAAAAAGDPERINLWAGTGHGAAREESTADTLRRLAEGL